MNKLFDLRFVIGLFFVVVGLMLVLYSLLLVVDTTQGQTVNLWCGGGYILFGLIMVLLSAGSDVPVD